MARSSRESFCGECSGSEFGTGANPFFAQALVTELSARRPLAFRLRHFDVAVGRKIRAVFTPVPRVVAFTLSVSGHIYEPFERNLRGLPSGQSRRLFRTEHDLARRSSGAPAIERAVHFVLHSARGRATGALGYGHRTASSEHAHPHCVVEWRVHLQSGQKTAKGRRRLVVWMNGFRRRTARFCGFWGFVGVGYPFIRCGEYRN